MAINKTGVGGQTDAAAKNPAAVTDPPKRSDRNKAGEHNPFPGADGFAKISPKTQNSFDALKAREDKNTGHSKELWAEVDAKKEATAKAKEAKGDSPDYTSDKDLKDLNGNPDQETLLAKGNSQFENGSVIDKTQSESGLVAFENEGGAVGTPDGVSSAATETLEAHETAKA